MILKGVEILNRLVGEGNWITIVGTDYESVVLQDGVAMPSREDFDRIKAEVEQEAIDQAYKDQRSAEYPDITDQLDMLYHDIKNGTLDTGNWLQAIEAVKAKYPKP